MLRIIIADDHFSVRVGLEILVIDTVDEDVSIDFASDGLELLSKLKIYYDVLLTDLNMPE